MATLSPPNQSKEVDYYLNPTELFRWINYRRWDGARARAQSHPDECDTWIVSRHSSDGRILWRHLPLHLVCMQKEAATVVGEGDDLNATVAARQIETLIDVLLDSYPEGASSPDDQGMLPLHLLLSKAENEPNERVINLLLTSFPNAVDVQDKFGRTPYDIMREQSKDGASDRSRAAFRALKRARYVSDKISATIKNESANIVAAVQHEASNERGASQKIIVRLEEELNTSRKQMEEQNRRDGELQGEVRLLNGQLTSLKSKLENATMNLEITRKEREDLFAQNEELSRRLGCHDEDLTNMRNEAEDKRQNDIDTIASLRSELNTSKAMTEALESQLRSRFTNEEYLSTSVSDLEQQLEELKVRHEHAIKKAQHEVESLNADNKKLKWNSEELTKKNTTLQNKLNELTKQLASIISSHSALSSEHDRLVEVAEQHESDLLNAFRSERSQLVESLSKQRQALEKAFAEQERIIEESLQAEDMVLHNSKQDRARGKGMVDKIRKEFSDIRTAAAERERQLHAEALAANRKMKRESGGLMNHSSSTRNSFGSSSSNSPVPQESRNPMSHHRSASSPRMPQHPSSSSHSSDGHLVRLLDERAAVQANTGSRRDPGGVMGGFSSSDSSQRLYYTNHNNTKNTPQRRSNGVPGMSGCSYQSPSTNGGDYSLDEYSHASETTGEGTYSDGSSYANGRKPIQGVPQYQCNMRSPPQHQRGDIRSDYDRGNGLQYIHESYGDESTME